MTLFERVKKLAGKNKMTIAELERKLEMGSNTLYKWKKQKPSIDKVQKVADYFNVSVDFLLGRTDKKKLPEQNIDTIAAHHDGEEWTEKELEEIERFKEFVRLKRKQ
ncbi:helix-turn-helix domain-containing protein [Virgibacillus proomii]|jgi:transcriptional regulator with XRE-family HTH domain|uniref:helix-turn-helix domain-containing protein n=1 Tax=Virgibacillus proomii TaxID=84407 RepID=UPI0009865260|nr:helix-turn-helix transcriptional regulator [Virgibacillus proomii]